MALLQEWKLVMFWAGKVVVKTTIFYLNSANTFLVEDCMFPRPGLNQVFWFKKMGDREIKCFVLFRCIYILALLLLVCSPD